MTTERYVSEKSQTRARDPDTPKCRETQKTKNQTLNGQSSLLHLQQSPKSSTIQATLFSRTRLIQREISSHAKQRKRRNVSNYLQLRTYLPVHCIPSLSDLVIAQASKFETTAAENFSTIRMLPRLQRH
jgi:hypothetical protein